MTTRITETIEHQASPDQVFALFCSTEYQELKCTRSGATDHDVAIEVEGDAVTVVTRRSLPSDGLPDFAKNFVGKTIEVVETQRWGAAGEDGAREAALEVEIPGTPVQFVGGIDLEPSDGGSTQRVDGELKAHVPLLGGKIEKAVAPILVRAVRLEGRVVAESLGQDS